MAWRLPAFQSVPSSEIPLSCGLPGDFIRSPACKLINLPNLFILPLELDGVCSVFRELGD